MKEIRTETIIEAPPQKVWNVLIDFGDDPRWNSMIKAVSGNKQAGALFTVPVQPPGEKETTYTFQLLAYKENEEFRWKEKLWIKGVFDIEHYFLFSDRGDHTTTFTHGKKFSGFLVRILGKALEKTRVSFEQVNQTIKAQSESSKPVTDI